MMPHKPFKVASVSSNPNSFGLHGHIMVAEDGESWEVGRSRAEYPGPWERLQVVDVPLKEDPVRHITVPAWEEVHCEIPRRLPDAPPNVMAEVWGEPVEAEAAAPVPPREVTPSIVFTAAQFTPTQGVSAQDKADFANAFVRFVENGFQQAHFTEKFYRRLCQTFGHAAHYNQATFYRTFFATSMDKVRFLGQTVEHEPVGDPAYTFSDAERLLRKWVLESHAIDRLEKTAAHAQNRAEREQLKRLLDKHGPPEGEG